LEKQTEYEKYLPYASDKQKKVVELLGQHKTLTAVAGQLNCSKQNVSTILQRLVKTAKSKGFNEEHGLVDPVISGTSTLYGAEGEKKLTWVKTKTTQEQKTERILNILESYEYRPAPVIKAAEMNKSDDTVDLATLYTLTDYHLGMYSWAQETGDDWDTDIAERVMMNAINDMAARSPNSHTGILNIQGDFLHWDGLDAVTPASGHVLDADSRFDRMIELAIDLNIWAIERLLEKHQIVKVIICEGNHDLAGSAWLRKCLKKVWVKNTRVEVDDSSFPYYAMLHGNIMLGFHHGHKKKNKDLPMLFSSEPRYRKMWGNAEYTYIHTGHYHHTEQDMSEQGGAIVERHQTLAGRDAYAARGGWISRRGAKAITYHKTRGEVERISVLPREK